ncbi:DEAD/DEAH box helicase family protein [Enterobacter ludwigii]|nr:DEAD/DEAH box helicase family protein [Enterobacter ludwigii]ELK6199715.1 DEAD/DEAH box helicase family protein [Enterobacter ludwigii]
MEQSRNFEMLRSQWPDLASLATAAEQYVHSDPESCLVKLRNYDEQIVRWIYRQERLPEGFKASLYDLMNASVFTSIMPEAILMKMDALRIHGNRAAHGSTIKAQDAYWLLKEAFLLGLWLYVRYAQGNVDDCQPFALPPLSDALNTSVNLTEQQKRLDTAIKDLDSAREREIALQRALQKEQEKTEILEQRLHEVKDRNQQVADILSLDEAETRRHLIDSRLIAAGWDVAPDAANTEQVSQEHPVKEQPTTSGNGFADYVLWDDSHKPIAVVEAKKTKVSPDKGRTQARLYADWLEKEYGQRPVIFYTNGYDIYLWDDHKTQGYPPRKVFGFYSKESLQYLIQQRETRLPLNEVPHARDSKGELVAGRLYQQETLARVSERFTQKYRQSLIVQATGTGKTRVAIALSKLMIDARWVKRVLFLCDRRELRKQAGNAFKQYISDPMYVVGVSPKKDMLNARVYIATYPGMMNIMDRFDVGYFDLIIADESHRSIYNVYGDLFKYFDALQVGLTATPIDMVSKTTFGLFGCEGRIPTANYSLEDAIADNNLVPYEVVTHTTQFLREGIRRDNLSNAQIRELEEQNIDPNTLEFDNKAIDDRIYNRDTNRLILRNLMENGIKDKDGQLPGKSIIFARGHDHAILLRELFDEMYPQFAGRFCQVIDNQETRSEQLIEDFKGLDESTNKELIIAISVDMLDTGIDVPEIVNLVFAKPVKSKVKFWQMIGRGTRLAKGLYGFDENGKSLDKEKFRIFDHWGNFEYHELNTEEIEVTASKPLAQKRFEAWIELGRAALRKFDKQAVNRVAAQLLVQINALDENSIAVQERWQQKAQCSDERLLQQFAPQTQQVLLDFIAPLMQWVDVRGQSDAMRFDMDILAAQTARYTNMEELDLLWPTVVEKLERLPPHLVQVQQQGARINNLRELSWWKQASFDDFEDMRIHLRGIMHLMEKEVIPQVGALTVDVTEDVTQIETGIRKTQVRTVDFRLWRQQVQGALEPLFQQNPVLKKIRHGEPVTPEELDELAKLVLIQNPNIDIRDLKSFFPQATASLDKLLRTIIGMDGHAVAERFALFASANHLNSQQIRFLEMLKNHIRDYGTIEMKQLFEQPFTQIHGEGVTGIFPDMQQIVTLQKIVEELGVVIPSPAL